MPNVTIKRGDATFEISDLTFDQVKELAGLNGHGSKVQTKPTILRSRNDEPDYKAFFNAIGDRGRKFFAVLRQNQGGVTGEDLAEKIGFNNPIQIGGLTGAGLARWAREFDVPLAKLYQKQRNKLETGAWQTTYKPGSEILRLF